MVVWEKSMVEGMGSMYGKMKVVERWRGAIGRGCILGLPGKGGFDKGGVGNTIIFMKQIYKNDLTMFATVKDFMGLHGAETSGVPAIGSAVGVLTGLIAQIDAVVTAQGAPLTGIAADKVTVRRSLEDAVFLISQNVAAYADAAGNHTLLREVDISRTGLEVLGAEALDAYAQRVATRAAVPATLSALTGTYGITLGQVTAVTTARTAFAPWVSKPRTARADRAGLTATIPVLIRQGKALLRGQLDRLMGRYRLTNPTLYAAYKTARVIVDRRGAGGTAVGKGAGRNGGQGVGE